MPLSPFNVFLLIVVLACSTTSNAEYVIHEERSQSLGQATVRHRVKPDTIIPIRIALKQNENGMAKAEEWLMAVSDPDSPKYGQFWTQDDIIEAFRPAADTSQAVRNWLSSHGIEHASESDNKQWLAFGLPAKDAEAMLKTEYFETVTPSGHVEVSCDSYSLPDDLREHVDFVKPSKRDFGLTTSRGVKASVSSSRKQRIRRAEREQSASQVKLPPPSPKHPPKNPDSLKQCDREVSPACIRALYNFTVLDPTQPVCANNSMGIFEEEDLYYQGDLDRFYSHFTSIPNGTAPIDLRIDGGQAPPDAPHAPGWKQIYGESDLDLQCALPIIYPQNATIYQTDDQYYAHAADYGYDGLQLFNDFLDAIDGSYCTYSAFGETGNDPKHDPIYPDPHKNGYKGKLQCGVFKPTSVVSISYGPGEKPEYYHKRQCNEFLKLALQGVSVFVASGDSGSGCFKSSPDSRRLYYPDGAATCPWVTGVGATQISKGNTVNDPESAAEESWAGIASGGGFSFIFEPPKYQKEALARYFEVSNNASDLPFFTDGKYKGNDGVYNRNGRGVPDIAAIGTNIAGWTRDEYSTNSGTSASSPIVAALFNRIIEERIRAGKRGPLGLINPTLYKNPSMMTDITIGWNGECVVGNRIRVRKEYGYNCTQGWDPVTGLGTPKYPEMLKVFMALP